MKKLVIMGNSSYSEMMKSYIMLTGFGKVIAYAVDGEFIEKDEIGGTPVISLEKLRDTYPAGEMSLIMGIGYAKMSEIRRKIFEKCKEWGYCFENFVHPTAIIAEDVTMGEGNNFLEGVIVEVGSVIGNGNLFFGGSLVAHGAVIGDYNTFSVKAVTAGHVTVKNHCFLGASSVVKDSVTLGNYVLLGAGAVGFKNLEPYSVVVPANSKILEGRKSIEFF